MFTVIENISKEEIKETYKLKGENNNCVPLDDFVKDDSGSIVPTVVLCHDQTLIGAKEMNELIQKQARCFDTPDEYNEWKNKNPLKLDEDGKSIDEKIKKDMVEEIKL